jgi:CBS domain containing-hemolysin-like protein
MPTQYARLPVHHFDSSVNLMRPSCVLPERVTLENPALDSMTDFTRATAFIATLGDTIRQAEERMKRRKVRLLFVMNDQDQIAGLVTSTDIQGEKPMQLVHARGIRRDEVLVSDIMTPLTQLEAVNFEDLRKAKVGHVLETLKASGRQHALVVETVAGQTFVRGLLSLSMLTKQLGINVVTAEVAQTFAAIQSRLAGE